jgi:arylsulfatase A-like enzyme
VIDTLRRLKLDENTLVIFTSDNGATPQGSNGPLRGFKGSDWEGGHREPAIAWWPGHIRPGVTDQLAITLDIMPTLLEFAGVSAPADRKLDGVSLVPLLLRGEKIENRKLYWNGHAMHEGTWSLVRNMRDQKAPALYNLADDLGQQHDLAAKEPERVKRMIADLEAWQTDVTTGATKQPSDK